MPFKDIYFWNLSLENWRHDVQHNDSQHNDIQHNDIQHNDIQHNGIQHNDIHHTDIQHNIKNPLHCNKAQYAGCLLC